MESYQKVPKYGSKARIIFDMLHAVNGGYISIEVLSDKAGTLSTSTTISQIRKLGWEIKNVQFSAYCQDTGTKNRCSLYALIRPNPPEESDLPFAV